MMRPQSAHSPDSTANYLENLSLPTPWRDLIAQQNFIFLKNENIILVLAEYQKNFRFFPV